MSRPLTAARTSAATKKPMWMVRRTAGFLHIPQVTCCWLNSLYHSTRLGGYGGNLKDDALKKYCELESSCIPLRSVNTRLPWILLCGQLCVLARMFWRSVTPDAPSIATCVFSYVPFHRGTPATKHGYLLPASQLGRCQLEYLLSRTDKSTSSCLFGWT